MKIAFISYWSCPLTRLGVLASGGMNVYVMNLANYLGLSGHQVDIYTRNHGQVDTKNTFTHKNVKVVHLSSGAGKVRDEKSLSDFSNDLIDYINNKQKKYDIIHTHYYLSGVIGKSVGFKLKLPVATLKANCSVNVVLILFCILYQIPPPPS